jgi:hypothetical protein
MIEVKDRGVCSHCHQPINQRPVDQGGEGYITRLEPVDSAWPLVSERREYHTRCLSLANELARVK